DSPEASAANGVRLFCESGGPNSATEEIQYLPEIVTAAESSPAAAEACAYQIRRFLSKDHYAKPHVQYNSIMLIRILTDNPGPTFTRNIDAKFVSTVKELLRNGRDPSVQQILRETLFSLERDKAYDTNLNALFHMWRKEHINGSGANAGPRALNAPPWSPGHGATPAQGFSGNRGSSRHSRGLPSPSELAARVEEARTSAKLLLQLIQSTPPEELANNELVKEFGERCQQAQRSIQNYINAATEDSTQADDETMLTLIETNEQLSLALTKHQRAYLAARRNHSPSNVPTANGFDEAAPTSTPTPPPAATYAPQETYAPPPNPPPRLQQSLAARDSPEAADDPFSDSHAASNPQHPLEPAHYGSSGVMNSNSSNVRPSGEFQATPSYLHRQESADVHRSMHGGVGVTPTEERSGGYGTGLGDAPDVSPVEERKVVYRY
ncbi:hypothetical protein B0J12DRAFT_569198, partial [Macrophomina phaseolina]